MYRAFSFSIAAFTGAYPRPEKWPGVRSELSLALIICICCLPRGPQILTKAKYPITAFMGFRFHPACKPNGLDIASSYRFHGSP